MHRFDVSFCNGGFVVPALMAALLTDQKRVGDGRENRVKMVDF